MEKETYQITDIDIKIENLLIKIQENLYKMAIARKEKKTYTADSFDELVLIEQKFLSYSPNMIIVYDGWNDLREKNSADELYHNWNSMCDIGDKNNLDVIVIMQPIAGFGKNL